MATENDYHSESQGLPNGSGSTERALTRTNGALVEATPFGPGRVEKLRPKALSAPPTPLELARALQRRWLLALILAICCAIPPAVIAWFFVPVNYSTKAWLRADNGPRLFQTKTTGETSLQTHQVLIRSPFVLNAALRMPGVNTLPTVREIESQDRDLADWLASQIQIQVGKSSEYMIISMTGEHAQDVQMLVNAVTEAYLDQVVNSERAITLSKRDSLERTFRERSEDVRKRLEALNTVSRQLGTSDSSTAQRKQVLLLDYVAELRKEIGGLRRRANDKQSEITLFKLRHNIGEDGIPPISKEMLETYASEDPVVVEYQTMIERLGTELRDYTARSRDPEQNPRYRAKAAQLQENRDLADAREQELLQELIKERDAGTLKTPLQAEYENMQLELSHLKGEIEITEELYGDYSDKIEEIDVYSQDLTSQKEELERLRSIVGQIGLELEKLRIELSERDRIELMEKARMPKTPDTKNRNRFTVLGGLGGMGLALLGVAFFEFQTRRITNFNAIEEGLGVRVMGDVPLLSGKRWSLFGGINGEGALQGMMDESIDGIRSMLLHVSNEDSVRCVLVTSAKASEGKTTVASSLAASIGRSGRRTLLVDGDLRRPSVHRLLDVPNRTGFCEVLNGEAAIADVVRPSRSPGLWVMTAGQCTPEALQALAREGIAEIFEQLREEFDFIVVDSGPVLAVVDPLLLGPYTDGAILSVLRRVSQMSNVYETCERLQGVGVSVLGSVVNGTNTGRFGFDYYGYGYGYGYGSVNGNGNGNGSGQAYADGHAAAGHDDHVG